MNEEDAPREDWDALAAESELVLEDLDGNSGMYDRWTYYRHPDGRFLERTESLGSEAYVATVSWRWLSAGAAEAAMKTAKRRRAEREEREAQAASEPLPEPEPALTDVVGALLPRLERCPPGEWKHVNVEVDDPPPQAMAAVESEDPRYVSLVVSKGPDTPFYVRASWLSQVGLERTLAAFGDEVTTEDHGNGNRELEFAHSDPARAAARALEVIREVFQVEAPGIRVF